ncbi:MAG: HIT family protein [Acidobacteria bacterium]|nr:MAG: HIT family protein [Acidobacteriota bacterium]
MSDDTCLFCKIVSGSTAAAIVNEDEHTLTFLDHRPLFPGHCLLVPKEHFETLTDLPPASVAPLFQKAQQLSRAVEAAMGAEGTFVAMNNRVSQSVPHLHIHIVPRKRKDGLKGFFWPRTRYKEQAEMVEVAKLIAKNIEQQINSSS